MADDNVVEFGGITKLDLDPMRVLEEAKKAGLKRVVIIGYCDEAEEDEYFASSVSDGGDVLWMLERAKLKLLRIVD